MSGKKLLPIISSLFIILNLFYSCDSGNSCNDITEINKGIIVSPLNISCDVTTGADQWYISDNATYLSMFDRTCVLPEIDFKTYSLLGVFTNIDCVSQISREVSRDEKLQRYTYRINLSKCSSCKEFEPNLNWVFVPKLPENWVVHFDVVRE